MDHVLDLHRNDVDAPWLCALVDDFLQFRVDFRLPACQTTQFTNNVTQCSLRRPIDGTSIISDVDRLSSGLRLSEQHCIHVNRHGVLGERAFCGKRRGDRPGFVDPIGDGVNDRYNEKQPTVSTWKRPSRKTTAGPIDPLVANETTKATIRATDKPVAHPTGRNTVHHVGNSYADCENDGENQRCKRVGPLPWKRPPH